MRVAIVHDDLVQWGGAERVLQGICEVYPDAPIYTSVFDRNNQELVKKFGSRKIITSFMQKIPGWKSLYKILLPFYPIAFEQFNFDNFDLVISHTTRFAKSIITKPETKHVCFCHTPPRFLYHFSTAGNFGLGEILMTNLRIIDRVSSNRVDYFFAGSKNAQKRIKKIYKRESSLLYPFIDLDRFKNIQSFDGGYFIVISRLNKYKRVDIAIKACRELNIPLKIVGVGPEMNYLKILGQTNEDEKGRIEFLGNINDEMMKLVLSGAKALIVPGIEDFGLVALEAQALGKPVIAYNKGGSLETVIDGKTGVLFESQSDEALIAAIKKLEDMNVDPLTCKAIAAKFNKDIFTKRLKELITNIERDKFL